jgi:hypothetical protein
MEAFCYEVLGTLGCSHWVRSWSSSGVPVETLKSRLNYVTIASLDIPSRSSFVISLPPHFTHYILTNESVEMDWLTQDRVQWRGVINVKQMLYKMWVTVWPLLRLSDSKAVKRPITADDEMDVSLVRVQAYTWYWFMLPQPYIRWHWGCWQEAKAAIHPPNVEVTNVGSSSSNLQRVAPY